MMPRNKNISFIFLIINCLIIHSTKGHQHSPQQQPQETDFDFFYTFKNTTTYHFQPYVLRTGRFHCNRSEERDFRCAGTPSVLTYSDCCSYDKEKCCIVPQDWVVMMIGTFFIAISVSIIYSTIERILYLTIP
uniref:CX domain-containing protein n=1 Tax=Strongyloides papillosus TaxID=174720 RepID=A0A0N5B4C8_STREA